MNETCALWLSSPAVSEEDKAELRSLSEKEIEDRFFAPLEFGTAGLRGVMGPGLRRMNVHVVRHTTQALANLVHKEGRDACRAGVAIAYDCRHKSAEFAREAACVLAANGVSVRLFDELRPTPELSFAIREYGCTAGINITASHNPKEYNGYKVYWADGAQLPPEHAAVMAHEMEKMDFFKSILTMSYDEAVAGGRIVLMGEETDRAFLSCVLCQSVDPEAVAQAAPRFKIVYTPFHGAGYRLVPQALSKLGFRHILCEPEQMKLDGDFPTVASPNPENKEGFARAIELARQNDVDLIIGTDPDADRVGVVVRDRTGEYVTLSGNQMGVLLLDYLIRARRRRGTMPQNPAAIKTIVTTEMVRAVGKAHGVAVFDTFTGFKFMAELIARFEREKSHHYLLAFEESYGYLAGDHARDKDAVTASVLIAEMAAWYFLQGKSLFDAMQELYATYGHFREATLNIVMPGLSGLTRMKELMNSLRENPPRDISGTKALFLRDYLRGERYDLFSPAIEALPLRGSDVLSFEMADGTVIVVRPSGTEPKIKVYVLARGDSAADCDAKVSDYASWAGGLAAL